MSPVKGVRFFIGIKVHQVIAPVCIESAVGVTRSAVPVGNGKMIPGAVQICEQPVSVVSDGNGDVCCVVCHISYPLIVK